MSNCMQRKAVWSIAFCLVPTIAPCQQKVPKSVATGKYSYIDPLQSQPNPSDRFPETGEQRPSLVRELLCAAIHSRAAYGYAMAAGHMSNLVNFALMHTVHQIRFACAG